MIVFSLMVNYVSQKGTSMQVVFPKSGDDNAFKSSGNLNMYQKHPTENLRINLFNWFTQ